MIKWLKNTRMTDINLVGGKNASLGEMIGNLPGISIPDGFAVTTDAYNRFMEYNNLHTKINDLGIRTLIQNGLMSEELEKEIIHNYTILSATDVAVRSSSTAEDLQDASFAGQQETYLNVRGATAVIPSNVILADEFCKHVDGFSIGSNDLTQLTLGLDRDSALVAHIYDERNDAVKIMISMAIKACKKNGVKIGICGQGPSDFVDFAAFLVKEGIDSISLTPDSVIKTIPHLALVEKQMQNLLSKL